MSDKTHWWIRVDEGVWPDGVSGRYATREEIAGYDGEWIEYREVARICREHNARVSEQEQVARRVGGISMSDKLEKIMVLIIAAFVAWIAVNHFRLVNARVEAAKSCAEVRR